LCRKCTIEKAVPIFTFGQWIKGGCYHGWKTSIYLS
jgi:hypothetical protein